MCHLSWNVGRKEEEIINITKQTKFLNELITTAFVEHPLVLPGSAKYMYLNLIEHTINKYVRTNENKFHQTTPLPPVYWMNHLPPPLCCRIETLLQLSPNYSSNCTQSTSSFARIKPSTPSYLCFQWISNKEKSCIQETTLPPKNVHKIAPIKK